MGIFGTLASLFSGSVYIAGKTKDIIYDNKNRNNAAEKDVITYQDSHGNTRLTSTGQQIYSNGEVVKNNRGQILARPYIDYYNNLNIKSIEDARREGKKYAYIYHWKNIHDPSSGFWCNTELLTMNPYILKYSYYGGANWSYYMIYVTRDNIYQPFNSSEVKTITEQEFKELGGLTPGISIEEYRKGQSSYAKFYRKKINSVEERMPWSI